MRLGVPCVAPAGGEMFCFTGKGARQQKYLIGFYIENVIWHVNRRPVGTSNVRMDGYHFCA